MTKSAKKRPTPKVEPTSPNPSASKHRDSPAASQRRAIKAGPKAEGRTSVRRDSKLTSVIAMLRSEHGATLDQMMKATGWQRHSVRGAISGGIKKKQGLNVVSAKKDGEERRYRIAK